LERVARGALDACAVGDLDGAHRESLQQGFWPLICGARGVKPERHLALTKRVGLALAEA
jgi:hypothetical protein